MAQLPTAEEFLLHDYDASSRQDGGSVFTVDAIEKMKEFAKLHVEQALKEVSEKAKLLENGEHTYSPRYIVEEGNHYSEKEIDVDPDSILNSYSFDNIK